MFQKLFIARLCFVAAGGIGCATLVACGSDSSHAAGSARGAIDVIDVIDDAGAHVVLNAPAQRVISLIPSATETLIAIGATKQIVGRTRYDVAAEVATVTSVGGGIDPSVEAIVGLHPDVVISWANDKRQAVRDKLLTLKIPVFVMRTEDTTDIFRGIANIGRLTGHDSAADAVAASMHASLDGIKQSVAGVAPRKMMYVEFPSPAMTAGSKTFIGQLLSLAGGNSIFADIDQLWPNVSMEEIIRRDPDMLIVPVGEFKENAAERFRALTGWRDLRAVREGHVVSVPADLVSRPSPSIVASARLFRKAMHPEVSP